MEISKQFQALHMPCKKKYPQICEREDLPRDIRDVVRSNFSAQQWIPEVHFMLLNALVRDIYFKDDENYGKFCFETMKESYSGPFMRSVMYVMSPSVLALASEKRWSSYKRGVSLKCVSSSSEGRVLSLVFPRGLYLESMLLGMAKSIEAAISCTRAKTYATTYTVVNPQECVFTIHWTM